jgi:large subunit ribosomal protein L4
MTLPIFDFYTGEYSGENVVLDQSIFNQVVRKDIIQKVMLYHKEYYRKTFKWVKGKGDVAGSNRKPFQQKKTGRAPQGDIRAPNLYHGGRAHGARPRDYYFPLNKKIRLFGLQSMLTSKFLENKIMIINSEKLKNNKVTDLRRNFRFLKENKSVLVTSSEPCPFFKKGIEQIKFIEHNLPAKLDVLKILESNFIIFTKDGLNEFIDKLQFRYKDSYRNKKIPLDPNKKKEIPTDKYKFDFDPNLELSLHTPVLKGSYEQIADHVRDPDKKINEIKERRAAEVKEAERLKEERRKKIAESMYEDEDAILEKRRLKLRKERRMKLLKEQKKDAASKKKKMADMAARARTTGAEKTKKK